jgi:integrase
MAITQPIKSKSTIKKAFKWLDKNVDQSYGLIYRIGTLTGLRITDITELQWDSINWSERTFTVVENKGTRAAVARARLKVLEAWHKRIYTMERDNRELLDKLFLTKAKDLQSVAPAKYLPLIEDEINLAVASSKKKIRVVDIHPSLIPILKARYEAFNKIDNGDIFSRSTMKSNRAKNVDGVISRQSCWKVFRSMGEALTTLKDKIKGSCHGMRKTFARMLYKANNYDLNLVMQIMGWSDIKMVMRYLGFDEEQRKEASTSVFNSITL